jgi:carbon storage regulator
MLVLSRKVGEQIVIPDCEIVLTVVECRGGVVRLGIDAPAHVPIFRQELWQRLPRDQMEAKASPSLNQI